MLNLIEGLEDMVKSGRLSAVDIPDDYAWLLQAIANAKEGLRIEISKGGCNGIVTAAKLKGPNGTWQDFPATVFDYDIEGALDEDGKLAEGYGVDDDREFYQTYEV